jgi:hypothetical protein
MAFRPAPSQPSKNVEATVVSPQSDKRPEERIRLAPIPVGRQPISATPPTKPPTPFQGNGGSAAETPNSNPLQLQKLDKVKKPPPPSRIQSPLGNAASTPRMPENSVGPAAYSAPASETRFSPSADYEESDVLSKTIAPPPSTSKRFGPPPNRPMKFAIEKTSITSPRAGPRGFESNNAMPPSSGNEKVSSPKDVNDRLDGKKILSPPSNPKPGPSPPPMKPSDSKTAPPKPEMPPPSIHRRMAPPVRYPSLKEFPISQSYDNLEDDKEPSSVFEPRRTEDPSTRDQSFAVLNYTSAISGSRETENIENIMRENPPISDIVPPTSEDALVNSDSFVANIFSQASQESIVIENDNTLSNGGSAAFNRFFEMMGYYTYITCLRLKYCAISDEFLQGLYEFITEGKLLFLEILDLEGNSLSYMGYLAMASILELGFTDEEEQKDELTEFQSSLVEVNLLNQLVETSADNQALAEESLVNALRKNTTILNFQFEFSDSSRNDLVQSYLVRNAAFVRLAVESFREEKIREENVPIVESEASKTVTAILDGTWGESDVEFIDDTDFRLIEEDRQIQFASAVGRFVNLVSLKLIGLDLEDNFVSSLCTSLTESENSSLLELVMDYNSITGDGIMQLVKLVVDIPLKELSAVGQQEEKPLTVAMEKTVIEFVEKSKSLVSLKLDFRDSATGKAVNKATSRNAKLSRKSYAAIKSNKE